MPRDDTKLVEALYARLAAQHGSSALPQPGDLDGRLTAGDLVVEVRLTCRRHVARVDLRSYEVQAMALVARQPWHGRECGASKTTKRNWMDSGICRQSVTHVVVLRPSRYGEPGPVMASYDFRCKMHAEARARAYSEWLLAVVPLPRPALKALVARYEAEREAKTRREEQERQAAYYVARWLSWCATLGQPIDELAARRQRRG